jgi:hypothetical protein
MSELPDCTVKANLVKKRGWNGMEWDGMELDSQMCHVTGSFQGDCIDADSRPQFGGQGVEKALQFN